jgi:hypothetical protein
MEADSTTPLLMSNVSRRRHTRTRTSDFVTTEGAALTDAKVKGT